MQSNEINEILPTSKALHISLDDNPNLAVYKKMEKIIERMQKVGKTDFHLFPLIKDQFTCATNWHSRTISNLNYVGKQLKIFIIV
jgi:hypothetical protein